MANENFLKDILEAQKKEMDTRPNKGNPDVLLETLGEDRSKRPQIREMKISSLTPFENHPFKQYGEEQFQKLCDSIKENGVIEPLLVRKIEFEEERPTFMILAGHNRAACAKAVGLETVPCKILEKITDEEAVIIMTETNLNRREKLLYSEKAFAYKMQLDAIKKKAGRPKKDTEKNSGQLVPNLSTDTIGLENGESGRQIKRYIRLTSLLPALLQSLDEEKIAFGTAVNLSFLSEENQQRVLDLMGKKKISLEDSENLKILEKDNELTKERFEDYFGLNKSSKKKDEKKPITMNKVLKKHHVEKDEATEVIDFILTELEEIQENVDIYDMKELFEKIKASLIDN